MYVWNASETDIRAAAEASGVAIFADYGYGSQYNPSGGIRRTGKTDRSSLHFRLALGTERQEDGYVERDRDEHGRLIGKRQLHPMRWHRRSSNPWHTERRVSAVCWHGHYAFMRYLLALRPDARIKTPVGDYRGLEGFLRDAPATAWRNIGSQSYPVTMAEACFCHDYGNEYLPSIDRAADNWAADRLESMIETAPKNVHGIDTTDESDNIRAMGAASARRAFNDPTAECCGRDAADCDCRVSIIGGTVQVSS